MSFFIFNFLLFAFLLVTVFIIALQPIFPIDFADFVTTGKYFLAQIGITASVSPNSINTLAQRLQEKELKLQESERELEQKEAALREQTERNNNGVLTYLYIVGGILLSLILVNFYFDYRRRNSG